MNPPSRIETQKLETENGPEILKLGEDYFKTVIELIRSVDLSVVEQVVDRLRAAQDRKGTVFLIGNGGSASTSSHFANDLGKAMRKRGDSTLRILSLTDNVSWLTALANDDGYEQIFAGQLENHLRAGDLVIAISASGNSENLIRAVRFAKSKGAQTVGMIGFNGGALRELVDVALFIPSPVGRYGPVEDVHLMLQHLISEAMASR
ncbi:MAG: SIS domain-containing protein [Candidatus Omnitrophica bacterium]|nr:SIS domain-containing protein [Candidatus Omnitrophota bacterium]